MKKTKSKVLRQVNEILKGMGFKTLFPPVRKYYHAYFKALTEDLNIPGDHFISTIPGENRGKPLELERIYVPLKLKKISPEAVSPTENEQETEPETTVKNHHHLVILGGLGTGKTTLLKYLALKYCRENIAPQGQDFGCDLIPIPVILREMRERWEMPGFPGSRRTLRDYLDHVFEKYGFPKAGKFLEKDLKAGKGFLLLDGFDELITRKSQAEVTKEIFAFMEAYPGCKILVTSRPAGYYGELLGFTRWEVQEFDRAQVRRYIHNRWGGGDSPQGRSGAMSKMLKENRDIENLVKNPLVLSIIAARYDQDHEQPPKRAGLYERVIQVMLEEWDSRKKIRPQFSPEKKEFILRKLAFRNHCLDRRTISEKEIREEISRYSPWLGLRSEEYTLFLRELCQRSCILKPLFMDTYDFLHLSFQEFFTARELKEQEDSIAVMMPRLSESWWEEPILLFSGVSQDATPLVKQIRSLPEDMFYSNLVFSGKCIADAAFVDPLFKEEVARGLWSLYTAGEYPLLKERAIGVLSRMKPRRIIDLVTSQLTDKDSQVRRAAAETLGLIGSAEVLPALLMVLFKDKEIKIRSAAAIALGKIGDTEVVRPLLQVLLAAEESEVRASAAEALGLTGSPEALPGLLRVLSGDKDHRVRIGAAEALGKIKADKEISQLIRAFDTEKEPSVRWRIVMSLGKQGGTGARDILIKALASDRDKEVRESAAEGLGLIGSEECTAPLLKALRLDPDADVRGSAAYALGVMRCVQALPELIKTLITDSDAEVRGRSAFALGRLKNLAAIPYLILVFNTHKASIIRGNATFALGQIGGVEVIPFLAQALAFDNDSYVRYRAAEVLGSIGDAVVIPPLKMALHDEGSYYGWKVKDMAFNALEKISQRLQVKILKDQ